MIFMRITYADVELINAGDIEMAQFKNRQTVCNALVLQGDNKQLLGAIPLEDMHVLIHPLKQELIVNPEHSYWNK